MRSIFFALTLAVAAAEVSAADAPPSCKDTAMTQTDMNVCSGSDFQKADAQLHAVYQSVLSKHRGDKAFIQNLQTAQRAWLAWRDAEMRDIFPDREPGYYGSVLPMCWSGRLEQLTRERTKQLQVWLDGVPKAKCVEDRFPMQSVSVATWSPVRANPPATETGHRQAPWLRC